MNLKNWWHWAILTGLVAAVLFAPLPVLATAPVERIFRIEANRFQYSPAILEVNPGDQVTIELMATDVVHGLAIDGYGLETSADPGRTASITFIANKAGSFRFHCTVICGNMHPFMTGKLEVGQNNLLWRAIGLMGLAAVAGIWKSKA